MPFLKGVGLGFWRCTCHLVVRSCRFSASQDEDRSPCAEEVPGVSGLVFGVVGGGVVIPQVVRSWCMVQLREALACGASDRNLDVAYEY